MPHPARNSSNCKSASRSALLLLLLSLSIFAGSQFAAAQSQSQFLGSSVYATPGSYSLAVSDPAEPYAAAGGGSTRGGVPPTAISGPRPFSRFAFGPEFSPLGFGFTFATNITSRLNLRSNGSYFNYTVSNMSIQGFNVNGKLNMASARSSIDIYPFHAGFRLSPGLMFYNQNHGSMSLLTTPGQSMTMNGQTYYSADGSQAIQGAGTFGLGNGSKALTMTTGWGNVLPRSNRHITFPFEIGAAFMHAPTLAFNLTGYGCDQTRINCVNLATDPQAQANIAAEVAKYRNDISPLKTFPIASFGVDYSFGLRGSRSQIR